MQPARRALRDRRFDEILPLLQLGAQLLYVLPGVLQLLLGLLTVLCKDALALQLARLERGRMAPLRRLQRAATLPPLLR